MVIVCYYITVCLSSWPFVSIHLAVCTDGRATKREEHDCWGRQEALSKAGGTAVGYRFLIVTNGYPQVDNRQQFSRLRLGGRLVSGFSSYMYMQWFTIMLVALYMYQASSCMYMQWFTIMLVALYMYQASSCMYMQWFTIMLVALYMYQASFPSLPTIWFLITKNKGKGLGAFIMWVVSNVYLEGGGAPIKRMHFLRHIVCPEQQTALQTFGRYWHHSYDKYSQAFPPCFCMVYVIRYGTVWRFESEVLHAAVCIYAENPWDVPLIYY